MTARTVGTYCISRGAGEQGLTKRAADPRCPPEASQRIFVGSRVSPHPPVLPSNGRAPEVGRRGPSAIRNLRRSPGTSMAARPVQDPSRPSRPTYGPSRRLLLLLLQQQLDALSDEGRGLLVPGVRDQLPHEVPRRLIHAEGDDSGSCFHSLSSFACGHGRRSNPIRPSAVLFIENRNDAESCRSHIVDWPLLTLKRYARLWIAAAQNER
jgi:hypothetical protein